MRCVLSNHNLLLQGCVFENERLVRGEVVNGGWTYQCTGDEEQALDGHGRVVTRWPAVAQKVVLVPTDLRGDYNKILAWAESQ